MFAKFNVRAQKSYNIIGLQFDVGPHKLPKHKLLKWEAFPLFSEPVPNCFTDGASWHMVTRKAMYVKRNIEARSSNHCYSRNPVSITYSESVCL